MAAEVISIWVKRAHRGPMDAVTEARLVAGRGVAGSADQGRRRQVTLIDEAAWRDACAAIGVDVDPAARRANVLLRGLDLERSRGRHLRIGDCLLRIFGETRPCERMDEAQAGLRAALDPHWRAGVFAEVLEGGTIRVGSEAAWVEAPAEGQSSLFAERGT